MANLICTIDPEREIYVAKVTERRHDISPDMVADVRQAKLPKVSLITRYVANNLSKQNRQ